MPDDCRWADPAQASGFRLRYPEGQCQAPRSIPLVMRDVPAGNTGFLRPGDFPRAPAVSRVLMGRRSRSPSSDYLPCACLKANRTGNKKAALLVAWRLLSVLVVRYKKTINQTLKFRKGVTQRQCRPPAGRRQSVPEPGFRFRAAGERPRFFAWSWCRQKGHTCHTRKQA